MSTRESFGVILALTLAATLAGCGAAAPKPLVTPHSSPTISPTPSETPSAAPEFFHMPTQCSQILPATRLATFANQKLVLLGGPGGRYGDTYLADPTPEQQAGGITCIWGFGDSEISSVTISVAPLSPATRPNIVSSLTAQGLNTKIDGTSTVYWLEGDDSTQPAVINVLESDSWISVIETVGGQDFYNEAVGLADETHAQVYSPSE